MPTFFLRGSMVSAFILGLTMFFSEPIAPPNLFHIERLWGAMALTMCLTGAWGLWYTRNLK